MAAALYEQFIKNVALEAKFAVLQYRFLKHKVLKEMPEQADILLTIYGKIVAF